MKKIKSFFRHYFIIYLSFNFVFLTFIIYQLLYSFPEELNEIGEGLLLNGIFSLETSAMFLFCIYLGSLFEKTLLQTKSLIVLAIVPQSLYFYVPGFSKLELLGVILVYLLIVFVCLVIKKILKLKK